MRDLSLTFSALRRAYSGGASPAEVVDEVYRRIGALGDPALFIHMRERGDVRREAGALGTFDPEQALWGVPFVVKDNIDAGGLTTTAGCPDYAYVANRDAFVVARLRAAGALLIGKTNLDQFATGLVGVRSPYGIPRNAVDPALVPGGSSSGSATAVGHGLVAFSLGTDTAGSGRVPAAFNDIVGLKPSLGSLSARGVVPACRSIETVSIFARTVEDAFTAYSVAAGHDPDDAYSKEISPGTMQTNGEALRIAVPDQNGRIFFGDTAQAAMFGHANERLRALGHQVEEVDFAPFYEVAGMLYSGAWVAERYTVVADLLEHRPDALFPVTAQIIGAARELSAADAFRGFYRLQDLKARLKPVMRRFDLFAVPTIPRFYSLADLEHDPVTPNSNLGTYTNFVNLLDMCGIAVPTAPRADGRPGSITLLAASGSDALAASVARDIANVPA